MKDHVLGLSNESRDNDSKERLKIINFIILSFSKK